MKKSVYIALFGAAVAALLIVVLNIPVTTKQGIDYRQRIIRLPLYLKALDFFDRHFNYQNLVSGIINGSRSENEKALRIFKWTDDHIKALQPGMTVIDDHVWNIIIRGYGEEDQITDVFCVLCNYAGLRAAMYPLYSKRDRSDYITAAFVSIYGAWSVFDPYRGVYFENVTGGFASIDDIRSGRWRSVCINGARPALPDYSVYFKDIATPDRDILNRQTIQSPWKRFLYQLKYR